MDLLLSGVVSLGKKHKYYNEMVNNAVITNDTSIQELEFTPEKYDLYNLLKIDVASRNRNVDYILSVLKCDDMLYVSRAIKLSTWLITEGQYAHIIHPDYLNNHLFPQMNAKASNKLIKHIRHNLKTDTRVEEFYRNENTEKKALKWLSNCSVAFIEANIEKHLPGIEPCVFKRLCEKSITIFETAMKKYSSDDNLKAAIFFLNTDVDRYLDVFENESTYRYIEFGAHATSLIMKHSPERIIDKFEAYARHINIPTFVKYIKREDIKYFLLKQSDKLCQAQNVSCLRTFFGFNNIKYFILRLPKEEQFEFVRKVFINKVTDNSQDSSSPDTEINEMKKLCDAVRSKTYNWYHFAPFDVAYDEIKKLIHAESNFIEKYSMLSVLTTCAGNNLQHIQTLLQYFLDRHINDHYDRKYDFVSNLVSRSDFHEYDDTTWNLFNELLKNMDIYVPSDKNATICVEAIIIYNALRSNKIPDVIVNKFSFNTLKTYNKKLNQEERNKIFIFLYNYVTHKLQNHNIIIETEFNNAIKLLENVLTLLKDWNMQLVDYPFVINKIKEFIRIKKQNAWNASLQSLYNKEKSWRKLMFEDSIVLYPCEDACLNALKHNPELLAHYNMEVKTLCSTDALSMKRLLSKLRIYWPQSLSEEWTDAYLHRLNNLGGHKALIRGLCTLLPQEQLLNIIQKYAPKEAKINWNETDELTLSLQRHIAKNMHIARPQPSPDAIILYAKGDYLQYALPSLLALFYNLSSSHSQEQIPKLLNAPVSLQKHGIRFAFFKLNHEDLKHAFSNIWKTSKNVSIRAVIFKFTHNLLSNAKDDAKARSLWELLEVFIDNLSFQEDKKIYETLPIVDKVPINVRSNYLIKSYNFLRRLLLNSSTDREGYEIKCNGLAEYSREIMELLCPDFVCGIISDFSDNSFFNSESYIDAASGMIPVISAYLLCVKDEASQMQRYEKIFLPLMQRSLTMWNETHKGQYYVRKHFQQLLIRLSLDLNEYVIKNNLMIPNKMFTRLQEDIGSSILVQENYLMLTMWKLTVTFTKIINQNNTNNKTIEILHVAPEFAKNCLDYLKADVLLYFHCIYILFSRALEESVKYLLPESAPWQIYEYMISDKTFVEGYLAIIKLLPKFESEEDKLQTAGIRKLILEHPSVEVKMHYYNRFK